MAVLPARFVTLAGFIFSVFATFSVTQAAVEKITFTFQNDGNNAFLLIKVLNEAMIHAQYGIGNAPSDIDTSVMIFKKDDKYPGPNLATFQNQGNVIETSEIKIDFDGSTGCFSYFDKTKGGIYISTMCPVQLYESFKGISLDKEKIKGVYGIAQYLNKNRVGSMDGDFLSFGSFTTEGGFGTTFAGFPADNSGATGGNSQVQFPVFHAVGANENFALLLDNVYKMNWDFGGYTIDTRMYGDVRFYLIVGSNMVDVRQKYMDLVGKPPVPRKKALGLWMSEFGYDNWGEIDWKLFGEKDGRPALRHAGFPVDGVILDLQWYGAVKPGSPDTRIGSLDFDTNRFPDPAGNIQRYKDANVELATIEQSYVGKNTNTYSSLFGLRQGGAGGLVHRCNSDTPTEFTAWVGNVGQIDWSDIEAGRWFHDNLRKPNLNDRGIFSHWTDLGEPEIYDGSSCYIGDEPGKFNHADIHNIYNTLWHKSIYEGYANNNENQRPFLLSRAGSPGIQRYGAAMWSGDITGRLEAFANHNNAHMHMSFIGIDYYGSDIGGFWRKSLFEGSGDRNRQSGAPISEVDFFTQWFAGASWVDVPVRPHVNNCGLQEEFGSDPGCPWENSPAWIGDVSSNRFAIQQRYELIPYYYSLSHEAYNTGYPVISPPIMHFDKDPALRQMGSQKMIGGHIMVGLVASHGQQQRSIYLPDGRWVNYHTNEPFRSSGEFTPGLSLWGSGKFVLPAFVLAGGIIPTMYVDDETEDVFGNRKSGKKDDLTIKVYSDVVESSFTLWEDDGETVDSWDSETKVQNYARRSTLITQVESERTAANPTISINIEAAEGTYVGAPESRNLQVNVISFSGAVASQITLNGGALEQAASVAAFDSLSSGWVADGSVIKIKTGDMSVNTAKNIIVSIDRFENPTPAPTVEPDTERTIVFIEGKTEIGQDMFLRGGIGHEFAQENLGRDCNGVASTSQCAIPITHRMFQNDYTRNWKQGDKYLDWYGPEVGQCNGCSDSHLPLGTPMEWTTNDPSFSKNVNADGFGYTPLNTFGPNYWMLDVDMDCSRTVDGWFELKSFISNGPGWEEDISQFGTPYQSGNHFAKCGQVNVFKRGSGEAQIFRIGANKEQGAEELQPAGFMAVGAVFAFACVATFIGALKIYRNKISKPIAVDVNEVTFSEPEQKAGQKLASKPAAVQHYIQQEV